VGNQLIVFLPLDYLLMIPLYFLLISHLFFPFLALYITLVFFLSTSDDEKYCLERPRLSLLVMSSAVMSWVNKSTVISSMVMF